MAHDLLIRNGLVVDGTGAPGRRADVAVKNGTVVEIGKISDGATKVVDASDCVVAPGFIDPHTHYDAQICWDSGITPSPWHGVTSVVLGNCGVGIAPCKLGAREIAMRDLVNVEGIPFDVLNAGITWDWESFPEYIEAAARRPSALNLAFLAPLTPFRHYVMGEASMERAATPDETAHIKALLRGAVDAGAFGFSTTTFNQHMGFQGRPLACRNASRDELKAYANVLKETGKGAIEIALTKKVSVVTDEERDLLEFLVEESTRPITFLALFQRDDLPTCLGDSMRMLGDLLNRGVVPQTSPLPLTREMNMRNPFSFASFPCWKRAFEDKSKEAQRATYGDPAFRAAFKAELKGAPVFSGNWNRVSVLEVHKPEMKALEGRTVADIARERGTDGVDTLLDLTLEDDLDIEFVLAQFNTSPTEVAPLLANPQILLALGDAGAHVDMLCDAGYPTYLLGTWVRERQIMTVEQAVARLTAQPADLFGIRNRGRLKVGAQADVAIFDPLTVGSSNRPERSYDLPTGAKRMIMRSKGVTHTIVNGEIVWAEGKATGATPGVVLRS